MAQMRCHDKDFSFLVKFFEIAMIARSFVTTPSPPHRITAYGIMCIFLSQKSKKN
jgi:hypothetical protein